MLRAEPRRRNWWTLVGCLSMVFALIGAVAFLWLVVRVASKAWHTTP